MADPWQSFLDSGDAPQVTPGGPAIIPPEADDIITRVAQQEGIDPLMLRSVPRWELRGGGDKNAKSPAGAQGPFQLMPAIAKKYGVTDPTDWEQSARAAAKLIKANLDYVSKKYGSEDMPTALKVYAGGTNEANWGPVTNAYPDGVMGEYKKLAGHGYGDAPPWQGFLDSTTEPNAPRETEPQDLSQLASTPNPVIQKNLPKGPEWGSVDETLNGAILGAGTRIRAAAMANRLGVPYSDALAGVNLQRDEFQKEHPFISAVEGIVGSILPTTAAMMAGQEYAAAPMANALGRLGPALKPAISATGKFLTGQAGRATGNKLLRATSQMTAGAIQGTESGALQSGMNNGQSTGEQAGLGGEVGAVLNPLAGALTHGLESKISPAVANMAQRFANLGVNLRTGQIPGAPVIIRALDHFFSPENPAQQVQATRAITRFAGDESPHLNQEWVDAQVGKDGLPGRIGKDMNDVAAKTIISAHDSKLLNDITGISHNANINLAPDEAARVNKAVDYVQNAMSSGDITGKEYQAMTNSNGTLGMLTRNPNSNIRLYAGQLRHALDDALERASPADQIDKLKTARAQYKAVMAVDDLTNETTGEPDLGKLLAKVEKKYGSSAKAGDLGVAAEGTRNFLLKPPAGTHKGLGPLGSVGAVGAAALAGEHLLPQLEQAMTSSGASTPEMAALAAGGAGLVYGGAKAANRVVQSPVIRNFLLNQAQGIIKRNGINPLIPGAVGVINRYRSQP